jgi:hypothetical protein
MLVDIDVSQAAPPRALFTTVLDTSNSLLSCMNRCSVLPVLSRPLPGPDGITTSTLEAGFQSALAAVSGNSAAPMSAARKI